MERNRTGTKSAGSRPLAPRCSTQPFFASSSPSNGSQERSPPQTQHCQRPTPPAGGMVCFLVHQANTKPRCPCRVQASAGSTATPSSYSYSRRLLPAHSEQQTGRVPEGTRCPRIPASPGPFLRRDRTKRRLQGFDRPTRHVRPWPLGTAGSRPGAG